jgi:hypothetical protein
MPGEIQIHGHHGLRAKIAEDGAIHDCKGVLIGFINEDGSAGDASEKFMGEVNMDGMVLDVSDEIIGYVDFGKGTLRDKSGSHFATVQSDGTILDKNELNRGSLKNFTYHKMKIFASYIFFFDGHLIEDRLPTKLTSEGAEFVGVDSSSIGTFSEVDSMSKEEARLLKHVKHAAAAKPVAAAKPAAAAPVAAKPTSSVAKPSAASSSNSSQTGTGAVSPRVATGPAVEVPKVAHPEDQLVDDRGLVADADEKARREAERMNKMMGGMTIQPAASSGPKVSHHDLMASQYPIPTRPEVKSKYEVELWTEINRARTSPSSLISPLEAMKVNFEGKSYHFPGTHTTRITQEGVNAVEQALTFLKAQSKISLQPVSLSDGLSLSSKDLVSLAASSKQINDLETDEQGSARLNRYGKWSGKLFQNLALGNLSPAEIVLSWIIDDGNAAREHRQSIFNAEVHFVGVASGPHIEFGRTTVACFTSKYQDDPSAGTGNSGSSGTGSLSTPAASSSSAHTDDGIPVVSAESEYKVGPLTDMGDNYILDISNLGCPAEALTVRLLDNGKSLTMARVIRVNGMVKEAVQRMKLPFQVSVGQVSPVFNTATGILTLSFAKAPSGSTQAFTIGAFEVPAWPTTTNEKCSVQAVSSSEAYNFVCEPSKHLTKVAVSIDAEKKLTFDMQYTFETIVEGQPATKTVKMSSQFGLPFEVAPEQVSVIPNGDKGSQVKVLKTKPAPGGPTNQPDVTVPIKIA